MFAEVCYKVVKYGNKHSVIPFIPATSVTVPIMPLSIVIKSRPMYEDMSQRKAEYIYTNVKLRDILRERDDFHIDISERTFVDSLPIRTTLNQNDVTILATFENLCLSGVSRNQQVIDALSRGLDMWHPLVEFAILKHGVLCVILAVIKTSQPEEIQRIGTTDGNIREVQQLATGTVLAYTVLELTKTTAHGPIEPSFPPGPLGILLCNDGVADCRPQIKVDQANALKEVEEILKPFLDAITTERFSKRLLLELMTCENDVVVLCNLLFKVKSGDFNIDKDGLVGQLKNTTAVVLLLNLAGVKIRGTQLLDERNTTSMFTSVHFFVDALLDIDSNTCEKLSQCNEEQLHVLLDIFKSAVTSPNDDKDFDVGRVAPLTEPAVNLLKGLNFSVNDEKVFFPEKIAWAVECVYYVLYCLCGTM